MVTQYATLPNYSNVWQLGAQTQAIVSWSITRWLLWRRHLCMQRILNYGSCRSRYRYLPRQAPQAGRALPAVATLPGRRDAAATYRAGDRRGAPGSVATAGNARPA